MGITLEGEFFRGANKGAYGCPLPPLWERVEQLVSTLQAVHALVYGTLNHDQFKLHT
jgi:hypothetical protein